MNEELEQKIAKIKEERNFLDMLLCDTSDLKLRRIFNVVEVFLGFISPSIPLLFLYKREWLEHLGIIYSILGCIAINAIIVVLLKSVLDLGDHIYIQYSLWRCKKESYINRILVIKLKEFIYKKNIKSEKVKNLICEYSTTKLEKRTDKVQKVITKIERKNGEGKERNYYMSLIYGISIGGIMILYKGLSVLYEIFINIDFRYVLETIMIMYGVHIARIVLLCLGYLFNKIMTSLLDYYYRYIYRNSNNNCGRQMSFFDETI